MVSLVVVLWSVIVALNALAAARVRASAPFIAAGFLAAALATAWGAWRLEPAMLALGTLFTLACLLAYGRFVQGQLTWSHHLLRAAILTGLWGLWLLPR